MTREEREERIRALLPIVRRAARRVSRMVPGADVDDLVGDGSVGLIRAVDAYDPTRGIPLEMYARHIVVGAMLNGVRRLDPVSERVRRTVRVAERERFALAQRTGGLPAYREMERRIPGLARARADALRGTPLSLDTALPPGERISPDHAGDPQQVATLRERHRLVRRAVAALPARQRSVVAAHYFHDVSLHALGVPLGVSPQRVSQLHLMALARLRGELAAWT